MHHQSKGLFGSGLDRRSSFEPQEFLAEGFSVDEFIQNKRTHVPLDILRDDLGSHLKYLRSSLIELINQDYGQFVNLSSNLVGLDGRIQNISGPLHRVKNDLQGFVKSLESNVDSLRYELNLKKKIRYTRRQLQLHRMILLAIESSEKHMRRVPLLISSDEDFRALSSTCEEIANAQFLLNNCEESPMSNDCRKKLNSLMDDALARMNVLLIQHSTYADEAADEKSRAFVITLLGLYVELQKVTEAEQIFVLDVLKPVCDEILSRKGNVSSLLDEVENFIVHSPTIWASKQLEKYSWMSNYHFLTNCVLPNVIGLLKKHFPHIWSPANPDTFHSNWTRCEKFIKFLEEMMPSLNHLKAFREKDALKDFISKWQFPVYFQLRFHSMAIELESALDEVTTPCANTDFKLDSTRVMVKVLKQCWDGEKVYIHQIGGRFLKASALLLARYIKAMETEVSSKEDLAISVLLEIYSDFKLAELVVQQIISENLYRWSPTFSSFSKENNECAIRQSLDTIPSVTQTFFEDFQWQKSRAQIETRLIQIAINQSLPSITLVTEVPRLYRRTNRDAPTKHAEYVDGILKPIISLQGAIQHSYQGELWSSIGIKVVNQVSQRYKIQVDEVLTSVLRMEESLKRLKKVKGQSAGGTESNKALSDDDKIRRQIQIDTNFLVNEINKLCPTADSTPLASLFDKSNGTS